MLLAIIISAAVLLMSITIHLLNISVIADYVCGKLEKTWAKTQAVVFIAISSQLLLAIIFSLAYEVGFYLGLGGNACRCRVGYRVSLNQLFCIESVQNHVDAVV